MLRRLHDALIKAAPLRPDRRERKPIAKSFVRPETAPLSLAAVPAVPAKPPKPAAQVHAEKRRSARERSSGQHGKRPDDLPHINRRFARRGSIRARRRTREHLRIERLKQGRIL